jgi:two-component sensor histidine kinase
MLADENKLSVGSVGHSGSETMNAELHAADPSLVRNDDLLAALLSGSGDCIKILGLDGSLQFMSEGGKRVMEVDDFDALKGCPWPDLWQNEGNESARNAVASARNGTSAQFFGAARTVKGNLKFWDVRVMPVWGQHGKPTHLLSISTDITETRLAKDTAAKLYRDAQDAAAREAEGMRNLLQDAPSFMCVLEGPEHTFKIANNAYLGLVGYRPVVGLPVREAFAGLAGQGLFELLDEVYSSGKPVEGRGVRIDVQRRRDGPMETAYLNFVYQPIFEANGSVRGIFVEGSDVTDLKQAEFALREKEMQLTLALDAAGMGVWESTLCDGAIINIKEDSRAAHILGTPQDEDASYASFASRVHEDDRPALAQSVERACRPDGDGMLDVEYRILARPGYPEHWVHARAATSSVAEGTRFIGTVRDITDRKETEARQQLVAGELQHRIKNTFAMVSAIASQTLRGPEIAEQREMFNGRLQALGRAHDLLLNTSQEEGLIADILDKALGPHQTDRFKIDGPQHLLTPKQTLSLAMAVHELATNATKYGALSNDTGTVSIRWSVNSGSVSQPFRTFVWQERGGPPVEEPRRKGFGSRVISRVFAADFKGEMALNFEPSGLMCTFSPHPVADTGGMS